MSSSLRRRAASSHGNGASTATAPSTSASASASSRRARSSSSKAASKKRRYVALENRCRNPFCGAALDNNRQRYCDGNKFCQLRRGLALLSAWPLAPPGEEQPDEDEDEDDVPLARLAPMHSHASASSSATAASGDKRPRSSETPTSNDAMASSSKKARLLQRHASADSITVPSAPTPTPTPPPTPTAAAVPTSAARQVKSTKIDVVPLGVGMRTGGGGRYVRSGNRTELPSSSTLSARPPSFSRFPSTSSATSTPTTPTTPTAAGTLSFAATVDAAPPPLSSSTSLPSAAPASRSLARATSLPVTTTNRSRDPRVRTGATAANGDAPVRKTMSAADYLNMSRNKDATAESVRPSEPERSQDRPSVSSSSSLLAVPPPTATRDYVSGRSDADSGSQPLRRTQSDTTYEPSKSDWYVPDANAPSSNSTFRSSGEWHRPRESDGFQDHSYAYSDHSNSGSNNHNTYNTNGSNHYRENDNYDRKPPPSHSHHHYHQEAQDHRPPRPASSSYRADQHHHHQESSSAPPPPPIVSRAEMFFNSLLRPNFSHCDPFVKLIVTRMASFLPEEKDGIRAISYTTTTKRKLQFYLDYAKRVERALGRLAKLTVDNGVARLTVAGREWLAIQGTDTMKLYPAILQRLFEDSTRWRELIKALQTIHKNEIRTRPGGAIGGVSFLKCWSQMKLQDSSVGVGSDFDFQSSSFVGNNFFHYTFSIGNIEIGSGSAVGKVDAFKDATSSAFAFLDSLTILPPHEVKQVEKIDDANRERERRRSPVRSSRPRPSSSESSSSSRRVSATASSSSRTAESPRGNGSTAQKSSTSASTSASPRVSSTASTTGPRDASRGVSPRTASASSSATQQSSRESSASSRERTIEAPPVPERSVSDDDDDRMSISPKEQGGKQSTQASAATTRAPSTQSTTSSTAAASTASTATAATASTTATSTSTPTPAASTPACRFCEKIQETKPGMLCMKCLRKR